MKRFLIINIFGIGDVLFTTPLIRNIKEHLPGAYLGYICNKRAVSVLENNPHVDKIFLYEKDDWTALYRKSKTGFLKEVRRVLKDIKDDRFDVVIDLSLNKYANWAMWFLGIKKRVGFNYRNRSFLLTDKIDIHGFEERPVVEHYLKPLEILGIKTSHRKLEVFIPQEDRQWAADILKQHGIVERDLLVGLIPGGGASWGRDTRYRRWSPENHAKLADNIIEKFGAKVILLGDRQEQELGKAVVGTMKKPVISFIGQTTVRQYLALLSKCRLAVMNDGGPLHMAVAAGTRTVSLIGPVDELVYGPYPPQEHGVVTADISCRPCYHHFRRADCQHIGCLHRITIKQVLEKVEHILDHSTETRI